MATRLFGWTPDQFWQSTPAELAAILASTDTADSAPLSRTELNSLIESDGNGR